MALAPGRVPPAAPSFAELVSGSAQPKRSAPATLVALLARPTPGSAAALVHPRLGARSAQPGGQRRGSGDRVYSSRYKGARALHMAQGPWGVTDISGRLVSRHGVEGLVVLS